MKKLKRIDTIKNLIILVLSVSLICLLAFTLIWRFGTKDMIYTQSELDDIRQYDANEKERELEEESYEAFKTGRADMLNTIKSLIEDEKKETLAVFKEIYPEYVVCYKYNLLNFHPIDPDIPKNNYSSDNLVEVREEPKSELEKGKLVKVSYEVDGETACHKGIDVSSYQGDINWNKVAQQGYEFVFVRAMYRGYGNGKINQDPKWKANVKGAKAAGLKVGVYAVTMAVTEEEAIAEAEYLLDITEGYDLDLPYVLDIEIVEDKTSRTYRMDEDLRTDCAVAFLETIEKAGKQPMIYHNTVMGSALLDYKRVCNYPVWFANYTIEMYWPYKYAIWQYGMVDNVDGVKGNCDVNLWLSDFEEYLN